MWHPQSILRRSGRRHMPGICRYPAERAVSTAKQGGTTDKFLFALVRPKGLSGVFYFSPDIKKEEPPWAAGQADLGYTEASISRRH